MFDMNSKTGFLLAALLGLMACGGDAPKTSDAPPNTPSAKADARPITWLEGIYATSSSPANEIYDLFDDDPSTGWRTQTGAGPDEGIMLYFPNALPLQSIQIVPEEGRFQGADAYIQTYVNGALGGGGKPGDKIALGEELVKSLYIRFVKSGLEEVSRPQNKDEAVVEIESFPANEYIGVKELKVWNDKGELLRLKPPKRVRGTLSASSTLQPEIAYSVANLFDARKEFVWVEGNKKTSGEGESLTFEFDEPVNITAIQIWNGYQRSDEHFAANARVRDFGFGLQGGEATTYTLRDTKAGQKIELTAPLKGKSFTLSIQSIYAGSRYKDLAISDMVFFDGQKPFVLYSKLLERTQSNLRNEIGSSPLVQILNRRVSNVVQEVGVMTQQSLILRSDGTFVMYSSDIMPDDTEVQTLADGNWELISSDPAEAVIKVFGRWNNVSDFADYYRGNTTQNVTRIFSDQVLTDGNIVRGKRMLGTFYLR